MRAFIFDGFRRFGTKFGTLARAVTPITRLLQISVFLFFASVVRVEFLFLIYATVAFGMFALPYAVLTLLPNFYLNCPPYGTPLSGLLWVYPDFPSSESFGHPRC
ncbi:hypothetical protein EDB92DRAFT_1893068 [Lactarius akahatsu]|uniref:Uncharacterized protein n=1 Tax=Lactarius akahatsu TaxID=416441 RepID=A0AAD4L9M7_9AGAM|nr:hypothetical protein EDB92DRAFT_1893068 [Lactarius akahatsu]